jgi:hypothetical protein
MTLPKKRKTFASQLGPIPDRRATVNCTGSLLPTFKTFIMFTGISNIRCNNYAKHINKLCVQNAELLNVKESGTYSKHSQREGGTASPKIQKPDIQCPIKNCAQSIQPKPLLRSISLTLHPNLIERNAAVCKCISMSSHAFYCTISFVWLLQTANSSTTSSCPAQSSRTALPCR